MQKHFFSTNGEEKKKALTSKPVSLPVLNVTMNGCVLSFLSIQVIH